MSASPAAPPAAAPAEKKHRRAGLKHQRFRADYIKGVVAVAKEQNFNASHAAKKIVRSLVENMDRRLEANLSDFTRLSNVANTNTPTAVLAARNLLRNADAKLRDLVVASIEDANARYAASKASEKGEEEQDEPKKKQKKKSKSATKKPKA